MFWTLTSMRSHRAKKHMLVSEMFFEDADAAPKKKEVKKAYLLFVSRSST